MSQASSTLASIDHNIPHHVARARHLAAADGPMGRIISARARRRQRPYRWRCSRQIADGLQMTESVSSVDTDRVGEQDSRLESDQTARVSRDLFNLYNPAPECHFSQSRRARSHRGSLRFSSARLVQRLTPVARRRIVQSVNLRRDYSHLRRRPIGSPAVQGTYFSTRSRDRCSGKAAKPAVSIE